MRIFLDANILFSAARSPGAVRRLLTIAREAGHQLCVDPFVLAEARRNLEIKAPAGVEKLDEIVDRMEVGPFTTPEDLPEDVELPEKDRPVLAAAIRLGCDALVTGDRTHFGELYGRTVKGVVIHSPRSLADAIL